MKIIFSNEYVLITQTRRTFVSFTANTFCYFYLGRGKIQNIFTFGLSSVTSNCVREFFFRKGSQYMGHIHSRASGKNCWSVEWRYRSQFILQIQRRHQSDQRNGGKLISILQSLVTERDKSCSIVNKLHGEISYIYQGTSPVWKPILPNHATPAVIRFIYVRHNTD